MITTIANQEKILTSRDFCFWLQGFFEMREDKNAPLVEWQIKMIQDHLNLMFKHEVGVTQSGSSFTFSSPQDSSSGVAIC